MRGELDRDFVGRAQRVRRFEQGDDDRAADADARSGLGAAQRGVGGDDIVGRDDLRQHHGRETRMHGRREIVGELVGRHRGDAHADPRARRVVAVEHGAHHRAGDRGLTAGDGTLEVEDHGVGVERQRFAHPVFAIRGYEENAANGMYVDTCVNHGALLVVRG